MSSRSDHSTRGALQAASACLGPFVESPRLEAEVLLADVLGRPRTYLLAHPQEVLEPKVLERFEDVIGRRVAGEPVAYLIGRREFWGLDLGVTPATLIPRPETELLVELALRFLPAEERCAVADLGTGCGAVALALASERPQWCVVATDVSPTSIVVAESNARRLGLANVEFRLGNWLAALPEIRFDAIVSNPPYVRMGDPHLGRGDVRFEPHRALVAGADGLDAIRTIAGEAALHLRAGGQLALEHGFDQGEAVRALLAARGYHRIETHRDASGHERVTLGRWSGHRRERRCAPYPDLRSSRTAHEDRAWNRKP